MAKNRKYLGIPLVVYNGIVEVLDKPQINPLHILILEFICTEHNISNIIKAFGLDLRIINESIVDLMDKHMIYVDLENNTIYPIDDVKTAIDQGRLDSYLGVQYPENVKIFWAQDAQQGEIFMFDDVQNYLSKPPILYVEDNEDELYFKGTKIVSKNSRNLVQLSHTNFVTLPNVSPSRLIKTAKMRLREYISEGSVFERVKGIKNIEVIDNKYIYIPLKSENIGKKKIYLPDSGILPYDVIESWTKSISELNPYQISDLTPLEDSFLYKFNWNRIISKLDSIFSRISNVSSINGKNRGQIQQTRHYLESLVSQDVILNLKELYANSGNYSCEFIQGIKLKEKIEGCISKAERIVIIASAFITSETVDSFVSVFNMLTSKNVKIILIWGRLGNPLRKEEIINLRAINNLSFFESDSNFHSKFLIVDMKYAMISSSNFLSYAYNSNSPQEIIAEFDNPSIILELYEYSHQRISNPEFWKIIDNVIKSIEYHKNSSELITQLDEEIEILLDLLEDLEKRKEKNESIQEIKIHNERLQKIVNKLRNIQTGVLVYNLDHRKILRSSLQDAKRYIKIGTDRIIQQALTPVMLAAINDAIKEGIEIEIKWGREKNLNMGNPENVKLKASVLYLKNQVKNKIKINNTPSFSHAKYLILDNQLTMITSYNLLAFSGNGLSEDEITDELGIVISGKNMGIKNEPKTA
jgi:phosphatidylserine/phosphatidylglycerophosphate/cardiolipin synthase-like enzyme